MDKTKTNDGESLTLKGLFKELNDLFKDDVFVARKDDPKFGDIKSMLKSLVDGEAEFSEEEEDYVTQINKCFEDNPTCDINTFKKAILGEGYDEKAEDDAMTACPDGIDISNEDLSGGMIGYNRITDASKADGNIMTQDINGVDIPIIAFIAPNQMMEGVVETIRSMTRPTIVAKEYVDGVVNVLKASVACGKKREKLIEKHGSINALVFDEKSGMCRLSINRKDGYDFIFGENGVTRFIIFDELSCPATIPTDIVQDDRKWEKRMTSELPKIIEKRIEESKEKKTPLCNLPETCAFENCPHDVKKPIIGDIMKEFADAKKFGKVKDDTYVEFMKPENKDKVANAVTTSLTERVKPLDKIEPSTDEVFANDVMNAFTNSSYSERWERDSNEEEEEVEVEDTNPDCFRCVVDYMAKEGVDSIHFWTDEDGKIHCDVTIKSVYEPELKD